MHLLLKVYNQGERIPPKFLKVSSRLAGLFLFKVLSSLFFLCFTNWHIMSGHLCTEWTRGRRKSMALRI